MSAAPIVVRYDVQNSDKVISETTRLTKSLDSMRTGFGQTTTTVKQMEAGFRADAMGNFSTAVQNADTKVTGFSAKLGQVGSAFSQNATSFGVATASIWGVYNAYDGLEKIQIRAHAAATRVSTMETTLATLTQRRADAVAKGNLSSEQMALLNDRIADTTAKLSVAQERNADLQGDVNEAWGAFASQIGPQAVAAGGSIVQLYTSLKSTTTGLIPAIKNFFGSFTGGGQVMAQTRGQTLLLGQGIGNLPGPMGAATTATRGLSLAMKGLLIGTGVGIAITAIGLIAQHFSQAADAAETGSEDIEGSMEEMNDSFSGSEGSVKQWGGTVHKMVDGTVLVVKDAASQVKESLSALANELRTEFPGLTPEFISGKNTEIQKEIDRLYAIRDKILPRESVGESPEVKSLDEQILKLNKDIAENKNLMNLMFGSASKGSEDFNTLGTSVADVGTKVKELTDEGADLTALFKTWQSGGFEKLTDNEFILGQPSGSSDWLTNRFKEWQSGFMTYEAGVKNAIPPTEEFIKYQDDLRVKTFLAQFQTKEQAAAIEEATKQEEEANRVRQEAIGVMANVVAQTFGVAEATQMAGESTADYEVRMEQLSGIAGEQVNKEQQLILAYTKTAVALNINKTRQDELRNAMHTSADAVATLITSDQTLTDVLNDGNRASELRTAGMVEGRMAAVSWYDQMVKQIAIDEQFAADQDIIAEKFGLVIPAGIDATKEQMTSLILTQNDLGKNALAMGEILNTAFSASRGALQGLIDAATKGGKDWKEAWKDLDKEFMSGNTKDEFKEFVTDQGELSDTIDKVIPLLGTYAQIWDDLNKKERASQTKEFADALEKVGDQLDDITDVDVDAIIDPLLKLKEGGLTSDELSIWQGFFELFDRLKKEGGGIDDEDVKALQAYVSNSTGMGDLSDATEDAGTNMGTLTDEQQKIVDNKMIKSTIDAQTGAFELQTTYVDKLNKALALRAVLLKMGGGGGGNGNGNNGFSNVDFQDTTNIPRSERSTETQMKDLAREGISIPFVADLTSWTTAITQVKTDVTTIDALRPIVDFLGDHRQFVKAGNEVLKAVSQVDKLRPIVDFLGDHRQFMKAGSDVIKVVAAIDKLRPIVDFMGDHSNSGNFMDAADDVEERADDIDGRVVTVTFRAKRTGNWSAQHGMDMFMTEDAVIAVHKNEHVKVTPSGASAVMESKHSPLSLSKVGGGGARSLPVEISVYLFPGSRVMEKVIAEIPLEDTGMYPLA